MNLSLWSLAVKRRTVSYATYSCAETMVSTIVLLEVMYLSTLSEHIQGSFATSVQSCCTLKNR